MIADGENHAWPRETKKGQDAARRTRTYEGEIGSTNEWTTTELAKLRRIDLRIPLRLPTRMRHARGTIDETTSSRA